MTQADDQGRLLGDVKDVQARCLPFMAEEPSLAEIRTALDALEAEGWIKRYSAGAYPDLLQILHWWHDQHGARRAGRSDLPAPEGWQDHVFGWLGGPNKPDFVAILTAESESPRIAANRPDAPKKAAKSRTKPAVAALPIPNPVPHPDTKHHPLNRTPSPDERPWPPYEEVVQQRSDREDGTRIERKRRRSND